MGREAAHWGLGSIKLAHSNHHACNQQSSKNNKNRQVHKIQKILFSFIGLSKSHKHNAGTGEASHWVVGIWSPFHLAREKIEPDHRKIRHRVSTLKFILPKKKKKKKDKKKDKNEKRKNENL